MRASDYIRYAFRGLSERRGRAAGAAIGVAIAVTAMTLALGLGNSFYRAYSDILGKTLMANSVVVTNHAPGLTDADIATFAKLPYVAKAFGIASTQAVVLSASGYSTVTVIATEPEHLCDLLGVTSLNDLVEEGESVLRGLGVLAGVNLWLDQDTGLKQRGLGEVLTLRVGRKSLSTYVVGLLKPHGMRMFFSVDNAVVMDLEAFFTYVSDKRVYRNVVVVLKDPAMVHSATDAIRALAPPRSNVFSPIAMARQFESFVDALRVFLAFVSALSIGITALWVFDSTTISVVQRVKEIGILRAVGFMSKDVMLIFLAEAALTSLVGGVAGLAVSFVLARVVYLPLFDTVRISPLITLDVLLIAILASLAANVVAAAAPARAAARLNPVSALKYE